MRDRCRLTKDYVDRGTIVCERWKDSKNGFLNFYNDMYESYKLHLSKYGPIETTLDRINNDGNYEPYNCRWATHKTQNRNTKRKIIKILAVHDSGIIEENQFISDFCYKYNLKLDSVYRCCKGKQEMHKGWRFKIIE